MKIQKEKNHCIHIEKPSISMQNKVRLYFKNFLKKKKMPTEKPSQKFGKRTRCGGEKTDCSLQNLYAIRV